MTTSRPRDHLGSPLLSSRLDRDVYPELEDDGVDREDDRLFFFQLDQLRRHGIDPYVVDAVQRRWSWRLG